MVEVYQHLRQQKFPQLGQHLNVIKYMRKNRTKSVDSGFQETATTPPIRQYPVFKFFADGVQRRNSSFGRLLGKEASNGNNDISLSKGRESWITKRIKRPIDFRFSGAPICSYFKNIDDLISLYLSILSEKRLIVVSSRLR